MKNHHKIIRTCSMLFALLLTSSVLAASAAKIDSEANKALIVFREDVNGADVFLSQAAGYLIFPKVYKAGIGIGAETGEGVLRIGGQSVWLATRGTGKVDRDRVHDQRILAEVSEIQWLEGRCRRVGCAGRSGRREND